MTDEEKLRTIATQMRDMAADHIATIGKIIEAAEHLKASGGTDRADLNLEELGKLLRRYRTELAGIAEQQLECASRPHEDAPVDNGKD